MMMLRCRYTGAHENWLFWGVPILTIIAAGAKNLRDYPVRVQSELSVPVPAHKFAVQFSSCNSSSGCFGRGFRFFLFVFVYFVVVFSAALRNFSGSYNFFRGGFVSSSGAISAML